MAGLGIAQLPDYLVDPLIRVGRLDELLADWPAAAVPVHIVYQPNRFLTSKLRAFIDWLAERGAPQVSAGA